MRFGDEMDFRVAEEVGYITGDETAYDAQRSRSFVLFITNGVLVQLFARGFCFISDADRRTKHMSYSIKYADQRSVQNVDQEQIGELSIRRGSSECYETYSLPAEILKGLLNGKMGKMNHCSLNTQSLTLKFVRFCNFQKWGRYGEVKRLAETPIVS
jgi:hypothetical protein